MTRRPLNRLALHLLRIYRRDVSSRLGTACSLDPSCSAFAIDAYERDRFLRATARTVRRLRACHRGAAA